MSNFLRQINKTWKLHRRETAGTVAAGCLALVIDRRCVTGEGIQFRLAVSFGGNAQVGQPRGWLSPERVEGRFCFGLHVVGTRGGRMALFDQWLSARPAEGCEDAARAEEVARGYLAAMSDEQYRVLIDPMLDDSPAKVTTADLLPLDQYELMHDVEV